MTKENETNLVIPFADGSAPVLSARGEVPCALLRLLGKRLGLECSAEEVTDKPFLRIFDGPGTEEGFLPWEGVMPCPGEFQVSLEPFRIRLNLLSDEFAKRKWMRVAMIRRCLYLTIISRMLSGNLSMMHGTLLNLPDSRNAALLFGTSGVGKSTIGKRFTAQGGYCPADDMSVLTFLPDGRLVAQPSPTWSALDLSMRGFHVQFTEQYEVKALLHQLRGEDDKIIPEELINWRLALVNGIAEFMTFPANWLDIRVYRMVMEANGAFVRKCLERFAPHSVMGDLNGHILQNLTEFLS